MTIVGLGPGADHHVTIETLAAIERIPHRYVRTAQHPSAHLVGSAISFDDVYERADTFNAVYSEVAETLIAAAIEFGEILYAVPGSPLVLERSVATLRSDPRVETEVLPAISFLDVVWARLSIDPVEAGVTLIDGHEFAVAAAGVSGAILVAHTHANWVLSDIKLSIDDPTGELDATPVVILRALGSHDEQVINTTWAEMDKTIEADHLTSLFIPHLGTNAASGYVKFHKLARTLREKCLWDLEQTHRSLIPHLIEETYEVVDAIQALDPNDASTDDLLIEELGDLLYQIEFHTTIAEQQGRFTIGDVTRGVYDKLVRRHPHIFGDVEVSGTDEVLANWDSIKRAEKGRTSIFEGIPTALPSLSYAKKVQHATAKVGFDWPDVQGALPKITEELEEVVVAIERGDLNEIAEELGDLLFSVVNVARHLKVDPESALRVAAIKFQRRFEKVEQLAAERGIDIHRSDLSVLDSLWDEIK